MSAPQSDVKTVGGDVFVKAMTSAAAAGSHFLIGAVGTGAVNNTNYYSNNYYQTIQNGDNKTPTKALGMRVSDSCNRFSLITITPFGDR